METELPPLDSPRTLDEALALLRETPAAALPIRDLHTGQVVAVLARPEAMPSPPVPRLGGMATPLGVYLTDGVVSGGAGLWGLFLTGMTLGALALLAQAAVHAALTLGHVRGSDALLTWLPTPLIFVLLRLIPLSGTHAAEHQVVHCLERGLPLTPAEVRAMPRVHPRCGTNLFVGLSLFLLIFESAFGVAQAHHLSLTDGATSALALAVPPTLFFWRRLGGLLQQWFATRPATDRQIAGAIRAAQEVLWQRSLTEANVRFRPLRRLWSMGLAQVFLGYTALFVPLWLALTRWPALGDWLGLN